MEQIEKFLSEDIENLNQSQRIILCAESFDYEVLVTAEWLSGNYNVDIRCYRLNLSADESGEFLNCTCIYPAPELVEHARSKNGGRRRKPSRYANWDQAFANIQNENVVNFFRRELESGRESYLRRRGLRFRVNGKRIFFVSARPQNVYVWQNGRFDDDEEYWETKIGSHIDLKQVKRGTCLRFYLKEKEDFDNFENAFQSDLASVTFTSELEEEPDAEDDL